MPANPELKIGCELSSNPHHITGERMDLYSGWAGESIHTDLDIAKRAGFPRRVIQGLMSCAIIYELLSNLLGQGWIKGGRLSVNFINIAYEDDVLTARAILKEYSEENFGTRATFEVWCENQNGRKISVGTASGLLA